MPKLQIQIFTSFIKSFLEFDVTFINHKMNVIRPVMVLLYSISILFQNPGKKKKKMKILKVFYTKFEGIF